MGMGFLCVEDSRISRPSGGVSLRDRVVKDDFQVSDCDSQVHEGTISPRWGRPEISKLSKKY